MLSWIGVAECLVLRRGSVEASYESALLRRVLESQASLAGAAVAERSGVSQKGSARDGNKTTTDSGDYDPDRYIGLLDIFGFEKCAAPDLHTSATRGAL